MEPVRVRVTGRRRIHEALLQEHHERKQEWTRTVTRALVSILRNERDIESCWEEVCGSELCVRACCLFRSWLVLFLGVVRSSIARAVLVVSGSEKYQACEA